MPITGDLILADVVMKYPQTIEVMLEYGLHCVGCGISEIDTIEDGCRVHGMSDDEIAQLLRDLNKVLGENEVKAKTSVDSKSEVTHSE